MIKICNSFQIRPLPHQRRPQHLESAAAAADIPGRTAAASAAAADEQGGRPQSQSELRRSGKKVLIDLFMQ